MTTSQRNFLRFPKEQWGDAYIIMPAEHHLSFREIKWYVVESVYYWRLIRDQAEHEQSNRRIVTGFSAIHKLHGQVNIDIDPEGHAIGIEFYDFLLSKSTEVD